MKLTQFRGISPRVPDVNLPLGTATVAHNVNLKHGTLRPWMEPALVVQHPKGSLSSVEYGCCMFAWDTCVSAAKWLPNCQRLYITGRKPYPEVALLDSGNCTLEYARLGLPLPSIAPVVSYITQPDKSEETAARTYVYTFVNWLGEESGPSYASSVISVNDGHTVVVNGWAEPSAEYRVERVRLYRMATGFRTGAEKEQEAVTNYLMVDEFPITQRNYTDSKKDMALGQALSSREVREPPADLQGIIAIDNTAVLCGFAGNKLYFTKNHQPWNWPLELELTLDDNIVHIGQDDGMVYVSTSGRPYTVEGIPDCGDRPCRPVQKSDYPFPDIACGYPHSATVTPFGMVYSSPDGLVLLSKSKPPTIITDSVMASDDWRKCSPDTARLAYYSGYLFCVTDSVSFMLILDGGTYSAESEFAFMTTISDAPVDMRLSDSGELLMLMDDGRLMQWNAGKHKRPYVWVSGPIAFGSRGWFTSARLHIQGSVNFSVESETGNNYNRIVSENRSIRLPRFGASRECRIKLEGTGEVTGVQLGATVSEQSGGR